MLQHACKFSRTVSSHIYCSSMLLNVNIFFHFDCRKIDKWQTFCNSMSYNELCLDELALLNYDELQKVNLLFKYHTVENFGSEFILTIW